MTSQAIARTRGPDRIVNVAACDFEQRRQARARQELHALDVDGTEPIDRPGDDSHGKDRSPIGHLDTGNNRGRLQVAHWPQRRNERLLNGLGIAVKERKSCTRFECLDIRFLNSHRADQWGGSFEICLVHVSIGEFLLEGF